MDDITLLLQAGKTGALDAAYVALLDELRQAARRQLRQGRGSLCTTALVHEAWLKLNRANAVDASSRRHFVFLAAQAMRQIVVDEARARCAAKRGNGITLQELVDDLPEQDGMSAIDLIAVDRALDALEQVEPRLCRVVEMRYFGGYVDHEIADALQVTERTVGRDWRKARAYLLAQLA